MMSYGLIAGITVPTAVLTAWLVGAPPTVHQAPAPPPAKTVKAVKPAANAVATGSSRPASSSGKGSVRRSHGAPSAAPRSSAPLRRQVAEASPPGGTSSEPHVAPLPATPSLGVNASLHGKRVLPADNPWNQRVDTLPVDPQSDLYIASMGGFTKFHPDFGGNWEGKPFGIPYVVVTGAQPKVPVTFEYDDESDPGPYPIPLEAPIEGGAGDDGDRHILVVDRDNWKLYELFSAERVGGGYKAGSGAFFDLNSNKQRPDGWTSADAAGLPIFPGLVRYDEVVERKEIPHALRFTVKRTQKAYVPPARHFASKSKDPFLPPMGLRVRLKSSYDTSDFPPSAQVILKALKTYGMILADNGGNWFVSGTPDTRWNDDELNTLKRLTGNDFEVVKMGPMTKD